ncbi:MAG: hypothetical protein CSA34_06430 [Desulfobulbus propionicus]|nr:MAG: hypothetical protein CSA34_06430 [Desulfobulbus propionicus]
MKTNSFPDASRKFQNIYNKFFEINGDPKEAIKIIDKFLKEEPYYPEALIFKARMLLALGKNNEAIKIIELAEKQDKWRLIGKFDKAEAYLEKGETEHSISEFINAIKCYQYEVKNGIESYLLSIVNQKESNKIKEKVLACLALFWQDIEKGDEHLKNLEKYCSKNKKKFKAER